LTAAEESLNGRRFSENLLGALSGKLLVSCQPVRGGPLDCPEWVAAAARACLIGGAAGLRVEGTPDLLAVRAAAAAPILGLIKRAGQVAITPTPADVGAVLACGADLVAIDATDRARPCPVGQLIAEVHAAGALAVADVSSEAEGLSAWSLGADLVATTLAGYRGGPVPEDPDLDLVAALARSGVRTLAEGRYAQPGQAARAIALGAFAVVVGGALTRLEEMVHRFAAALPAVGV
jgi:putative N-acetylmannosamine-6-phosphate epimerase